MSSPSEVAKKTSLMISSRQVYQNTSRIEQLETRLAEQETYYKKSGDSHGYLLSSTRNYDKILEEYLKSKTFSNWQTWAHLYGNISSKYGMPDDDVDANTIQHVRASSKRLLTCSIVTGMAAGISIISLSGSFVAGMVGRPSLSVSLLVGSLVLAVASIFSIFSFKEKIQ